MEVKELALLISKREHIVVIGSKEMLDEACVRYGLSYNMEPLCEQTAKIMAAVNYNTRKIMTLTSISVEFETIRELIFNYARYNKVFPVLGSKMESLFIDKFEWNRPGINPNVLAETISRWVDMIEMGFLFKKESLEVMLEFCQLNELYSQCALIQEQLDNSGD